MAQIYFNGLSVSVSNEYEDICYGLYEAEKRKEKFIELHEFHQYFDEENVKIATTKRKIYIRIDSIQYIQS
jgi:hypothetical protein